MPIKLHDHGNCKKPCSKEKHAAISKGLNPFKIGYNDDNELVNPIADLFEKFRWALLSTAQDDFGLVFCLCCGYNYTKGN